MESLNRAERRAIQFGRAFSPCRKYHQSIVENDKKSALLCDWSLAGRVYNEELDDYYKSGVDSYDFEEVPEGLAAFEIRDLAWDYTH